MNKFFLSIAVLSAPFLAISACEHAQKVHDTVRCVPNPSDRFGTKDRTNVFITGDFLYFKPLTEELAKNTVYTYNTQETVTSSQKEFQNTFQPGLRLSLGYNTNYDGWDLVLSYLGFNYKHSNSWLFYQNDDGVEAENFPGKVTYKYNLNQGDLDLGRMFKISKHLSVRPHAGIRGLSLTQSGHIASVGFNSDGDKSFDTALKFQGVLIGVEMGLDALWKLSKTVSIFTNIVGAELSNSQNIKYYYEETSSSPQTDTSTSSKNSRLVTAFDMAIGLRYDTMFSNDNYHFGLALGYEQHSFININTYQGTHRSTIITNLLNDSDFTFSGISLGARLDF
jgi:Legionella pneumophila major outer membrane protein precursor